MTVFVISNLQKKIIIHPYSTITASHTSGAEGFTSEEDQDEVRKIERQLKNRFPIGSHVSEERIIQDFLKQVRIRITKILIRDNILS